MSVEGLTYGVSGDGKRTANLVLVAALGVVFITAPAFFGRLHSDEVIYWEVARNIAAGLGPVTETLGGAGGGSGGGVFFWHAPLPFYAVSPFLLVSEHIFTARVVSSLFTVASAVLVYLVSERKASREAALVSALVFLLSFQALRFGGRFYLDQYGVFFFLSTLVLILRGKMLAAGAAAVAMVLAREYWAGLYPFVFAYAVLEAGPAIVSGRVKKALPFLIPLGVALPAALAYLYAARALPYLAAGAVVKNLVASVGGHPPGELASMLGRAWAEYGALNVLVVSGFAAAVWGGERRALVLVLPQVALLSLVHGFVVDGGVTQYPLAMTAAAAPFAGPGLLLFYDRVVRAVISKPAFVLSACLVLAVQFAGLNVLATVVSLHGNLGVYGLGYGADRRVIEKLRREAPGDFIHGIHGAFVPDRGRWAWTDYRMKNAITEDPDWLVTYGNYVELHPEQYWKGRADVSRIGPYLVVYAGPGTAMSSVVRPRDFRKWMLRED